METLTLRHDGDPCLRRVSRKVKYFDKSLGDLLDEMGRIIKIENGVGLAAPQVGVNTRVILVVDEEIVESLAILNEASVFLRTELGRGLRVRKVPHLRFHYDDSLKRGARINELIHQALKSDQQS